MVAAIEIRWKRLQMHQELIIQSNACSKLFCFALMTAHVSLIIRTVYSMLDWMNFFCVKKKWEAYRYNLCSWCFFAIQIKINLFKMRKLKRMNKKNATYHLAHTSMSSFFFNQWYSRSLFLLFVRFFFGDKQESVFNVILVVSTCHTFIFVI